MNELSEKITSLRSEIAAIKDEIVSLQDEFENELMTIVKKMPPKIESIGWRQYTDYFNDGDACTFGVHIDEYSILINGEYFDGMEDEEICNMLHPTKYIKDMTTEIVNPNCDLEALQNVISFINLVRHMDEYLEDIYGDHMEINVYRANVQVDDYTDHN